MSHHIEYVEYEGQPYSAGDVLMMPTIGAWGQHLILGFSAHDGRMREVKVSRPYAYASSVGTTGPVILMGCETYTLPIWHIVGWTKLGGGFRT